MRATTSRPRTRRSWPALVLGLLGLLVSASCSDGSDGQDGTDGQPNTPPLQQGDDLPGFNIEIVAIEGGSLPNGNVIPGDRLRVTFTVTDDDGETIPPDVWSRGAILVSGPTFNYQRVIPILSDLAERVTTNGDGSFTYEFADPFPSVYAEPYNYTGAYTAGVMAGQSLLFGTYTVSIEARRDVEVGGRTVRDADNQVANFLVGDAFVPDPRDVVGSANCNACHQQLSAHGGNRTDLTGCLLCHTTGAEDRNTPDVADGTPGVSIDFRVMIHKIHTGRSLPSVLGMTTDAAGNRDYTAEPVPYELIGFGNNVADFSDVVWPRWPVSSQPMPRDAGYAGLDDDAKAKEDAQRSGPTDCATCHGDPDGDGPIEAPVQGNLAWAQPSRHACGSCHDDWVWDLPYRSNNIVMPPQLDDATCKLCHPLDTSPISVGRGHRHPLTDPETVPGVQFDLLSVTEAGTADDDGTFDPGERIRLEFTVEDSEGMPIDPATLGRGEIVITGPSENPQLMHLMSLPTGMLGAGPTYSINVPETLALERVGTSTATTGETFTTMRAPLWPGTTTVWLRTASGNSSVTIAAAPAWQNFVDVVNGGQFARGDILAIADGTEGTAGATEYMQVQWVDGNRLWFSSKNNRSYKAALRLNHPLGAQVQAVTLTMQAEGTDYMLDAANGTITEIGDMGVGDVVVTYTSDYEVPAVYTGTINDSPDLESAAGDWLGLSLVSGTYDVGIWASQSQSVSFPNGIGDPTPYTAAAPAAVQSVLFGDATGIEEAMRISSPNNCYACHGDLQFHGGGRRGYEGCISCHGAAAGEDRPQYVAAGAPATTDVRVEFREMIHKIHAGSILTEGDRYQVIGFGSAPYPDNYTSHTYEEVTFPALPGGVMECAMCHGEDNEAWKYPAPRNHPGGQPKATASWTVSCGSCHDATSDTAHMRSNQTPVEGIETCAGCHAPGERYSVERMHRSY